MALTNQQVKVAYERYGHLVLRRCRAIMRSDHLAQDALQEVFMRLLKYGDKFFTAETPLRWIYRMSDRVCFDLLRKNAREPIAEQASIDNLSMRTNPGQIIADRQLAFKFISRLDHTSQQVAILYFLDGLNQGQIARELGCARQTVNRKLSEIKSRAQKLKHAMGMES